LLLAFNEVADPRLEAGTTDHADLEATAAQRPAYAALHVEQLALYGFAIVEQRAHSLCACRPGVHR
jgi:hypothetical protein